MTAIAPLNPRVSFQGSPQGSWMNPKPLTLCQMFLAAMGPWCAPWLQVHAESSFKTVRIFVLAKVVETNSDVLCMIQHELRRGCFFRTYSCALEFRCAVVYQTFRPSHAMLRLPVKTIKLEIFWFKGVGFKCSSLV